MAAVSIFSLSTDTEEPGTSFMYISMRSPLLSSQLWLSKELFSNRPFSNDCNFLIIDGTAKDQSVG